ncbi:MAG: hypothetical protein AAGC85_06810 [Bacteroidota bacterium]
MKVGLHIRGNTLVEILVSLSVLSLLFVLGSMLFQSLSGIHSPVQKFHNRSLVREFLYMPLQEDWEKDETWEIRGRHMVRRISSLGEYSGLVEIKVSCYWQDQLILERSRYTKIPSRDGVN